MQNSSSSKAIGIIIVVVIVAVGIFLMVHRPDDTAVPPVGTDTAQSQPSQPKISTDSAVAGVQASGTSDAALDQDSAAIDAQMKGLDTDAAAAQSNQ